MRFSTLLSTVLVATRYVSANPQDDESQDGESNTTADGLSVPATTTSSASLTCGTGKTSSYVSDARTPTHAELHELLKQTSGLCALAGGLPPTLTGITCPTDVPEFLTSLVLLDADETQSTAGGADVTGGDIRGQAPDSGSGSGRVGELEGVLAVGVVVSVVVGALAAWL
ncbi:hypothetical protein BU23DRAFT_569595 [Bimuria novae-zelandiae CBS 107.79]|uniref:Uncharacterized protein n=1 Tax=Bimuria novae-zelandiae CBS 107.79 TaxID=1447943 RepID=A0A6A5V552_9PLEO|nr:hypothetical protein BU23DRAFT_569595 [Bimuria novae-zelandiae CBS 107.79]